MNWISEMLRMLRGSPQHNSEPVKPDLIAVKKQVEWLKAEADKKLRQRSLQTEVDSRRGRR